MKKTNATATDNSAALWTIPELARDGHKYTRGHVLVLGGEIMTGASRLAAIAALRMGAGLVTLAAAEKVWSIYAASLLSVIARPLTGLRDWQKLLEDERINTVLIGPGAGVNDFTAEAILAASDTRKTLLLDADALTLMAQDGRLCGPRAAHLIVTPHEGEYALLAKALKLDRSKDKVDRARDLASALSVVVVLKGAETVIADAAGKAVVNRNAPPTLATGGTGDVLAGMIAGLVAQGMGAFDAACAATYVHGEAANHLGHGLIAEDLLGAIPEVLRKR